MSKAFLRRITLRNYKSIAACQLELSNLTFLVGPNGSGKSNFLDAIRLVSESLRTSLDHALRERGTIKEVRRRSGGHPNHFSIRLDFTLPSGQEGHYSFRIGAKSEGGFVVQDEECRIFDPRILGEYEHSYRVGSGKVVSATFDPTPACLPDRLFLVSVSGNPAFRPVFDALCRMEVYNLNPQVIGGLQKPDPGRILRRDGSNVASVLQLLPAASQGLVNNYLAKIVKGVSEVESKTLGDRETIEFRQGVKGQQYPWRFWASSMSDGTLRALGILLAVFQGSDDADATPLLVGLEEPEIALHPAAADVLLAALREGAKTRQVIVTSHSPDLLDNPDIEMESLLAVENTDGITTIARIDRAGRDMLRQKLFTAGELLRQNQLAPDYENALSDVRNEDQLNFFELGN